MFGGAVAFNRGCSQNRRIPREAIACNPEVMGITMRSWQERTVTLQTFAVLVWGVLQSPREHGRLFFMA